MMPSPRRKRLVLFAIILAVLVVIYLTTGAKSTQSSPFYKKTVDLMEAKAQVRNKAVSADSDLEGRELGDGGLAQGQESDEQAVAGEPDLGLMERLRVAEVAAKKSADEKWRQAAANGPEDNGNGKGKAGDDTRKKTMPKAAPVKPEVKAPTKPEPKNPTKPEAKGMQDSDGTVRKEKGIAGRKKFPKDAGTAEDGIAHVGPHADAPKIAASIAEDRDAKLKSDAVDKELLRILTSAPMVIFSKSYCPFSLKAKRILLEAFTITPAPYVVELDQHELGHELQEMLAAMTGRRTVPNVMVNGQSLGGGDDMEALWKEGRMKEVLKKEGGKSFSSVVENLGEGGKR